MKHEMETTLFLGRKLAPSLYIKYGASKFHFYRKVAFLMYQRQMIIFD